MRPPHAHIWVWGIAELKMQNKLASFGHRKARIRPLELALKERYLAHVSFARKRASRPSLDQGGFEATHSQLICLDAIAAVMVWSKTGSDPSMLWKPSLAARRAASMASMMLALAGIGHWEQKHN